MKKDWDLDEKIPEGATEAFKGQYYKLIDGKWFVHTDVYGWGKAAYGLGTIHDRPSKTESINGETMSNENEIGKEIYLEYLTKKVGAENIGEMKAVNRKYELGGVRLDEYLELCVATLSLHCDYKDFKRAPKTIRIGDKDVPAPRYDRWDKPSQKMYSFCRYGEGGVACNRPELTDSIQLNVIVKFGWFDNEKDAITYANAHRENKT